jgi:cell division protein FtsI (penicillin-binding protein 3)
MNRGSDDTVRKRAAKRARIHRRRTRILALLVVLGAFASVARLADLQLRHGSDWLQLAVDQNSVRVTLQAPRGTIYDRDMRPLSVHAEEYRLYLAPSETRDLEAAIGSIDRIIGLSRAEKRELRQSDKYWVPIRSRVSSSDHELLLAAAEPGIHFDTLAGRVYPEGDLAAGLLGHIDPHGIGVSGVELVVDSVLRGTPGVAMRRRDAIRGLHRVPDQVVTPAVRGHDVVLTIDIELQSIATAALERALEQTGAAGGDILMADPRTGEILAVASRRGRNRTAIPAFTDPYEPGSIMKPFLLAALLGEKAARLDERIDTEGGIFREGGRVIEDVDGHDTLTVAEVVQFSSNIGAVKLAHRLDRGVQYRYLRDFGFGRATGIEYPAESAGRLRRPTEWSGFSQASLAIGYELSATSLQLVAAYGALANDGVLMQPFLVKEVRRVDGSRVWSQDPIQLRRVVTPEVAAQITEVLNSVVREGTGYRAALKRLSIAGKTGTARLASAGGYADARYSASFVGYCPSDDPSLVILAKLEDPQGPMFYGGTVAAPISASALQAALATRGVALPRGSSPLIKSARFEWGPVASNSESSPYIFAVDAGPQSWPSATNVRLRRRVMPDLKGLPVRAAVQRLGGMGGVDVVLRASGNIRSQEPSPGTEVSPGTTVVLN